MKDNDFWVTDEITNLNQITNKIAIENQAKTIEIINEIGGLHGDVLDVGSRNYFTEILENMYNIKIDSTYGDLDKEVICRKGAYDFIHYNNVIEHQFNPLLTLLELKSLLKKDGILILGTPLKPTWITFSKCHFHEFDKYRYEKIIKRAGLREIKRVHYSHDISFAGIRLFLASFCKKRVISLLIK